MGKLEALVFSFEALPLLKPQERSNETEARVYLVLDNSRRVTTPQITKGPQTADLEWL